jgi:hypothetical protein
VSSKKTLVSHFEARIENAAQFAMTTRVLLLSARSGVGLDIAFSGLPFKESAVARSTRFVCPGDVPIRTCSVFLTIVRELSVCFFSSTFRWYDW